LNDEILNDVDSRNTILAVILSGLVLIGWQYFYNVPQMEKQRAAQQAQSELAKPAPQPGTTTSPATAPQTGAAPAPSPMRRRQISPHRQRPSAGIPPSPRRRASRSTRRGSRKHFAERRAHRRSVAGAIPRDRRSVIAADRAVLALGHG